MRLETVLKGRKAAAAFLALGWACLWFFRMHGADLVPMANTSDVDMGEQLLHALRLPQSFAISGTMPLYTVWMTVVCENISPQAARTVCLLAGEAVILLVFSLGWGLGAAPGALAALAVFMFVPGILDLGNPPQLVYAVIVLVVAGLLVRRARAPTLTNSLYAGLAIGASLLFRSPLAYLPPVLAVVEWRARRRGAKRGWKTVAALCLVPYLFLVPWLKTNRSLHHQWIPFEYKRADMNIALGAMGLVPNADGDWQKLLKDPPDTNRSGAVLAWAAKEVLRHPARYALSIFARLAYVASFHPWLFAAAMAALWLFRGIAEYQALSLLIAYFLGIHSLMTIAPNYMVPLWPLLAGASSGLFYRRFVPERALDGRDAPAAGWLFQGFAAVLVLAGVWVSWKVWVYPRRLALRPADIRQAYQEALAEDPDDIWLLTRLGHEELKRGDTSGAAGLFARATDLKPEDQESALWLAWTQALTGAPDSLWRLEPNPQMRPEVIVRLDLMKSFAYLKAGQREKARASALTGLAAWESTCDTIHRLKTELEKKTQRDMRPSPELTAILSQPLAELPPEDRLLLLDEIAELAVPGHAVDVWIELAQVRLPQNRPSEALAYRDRLLAASEKNASASERASVYRQRAQIDLALKNYSGAEKNLLQALESAPDDAATLLLLVQAELGQNRPSEALAYSDRLLDAYQQASASELAFVYRQRAQLELELKNEAAAEKNLLQALESVDDDPAALKLMIQVKLDAGRPSEALAYADRLLRAASTASPAERGAVYRLRAQVQFELKDEAEAQKSLKQALESFPDDLEAMRMLIEAGLQRPQEALSIVESHRPSDARLEAPWLALRGLSRDRINDHSGAKKNIEAAVRMDAAGVCYGDLFQAHRERLNLIYFDRCVERFPHDAVLYSDRGVARFQLGQRDGAVSDFRKAAELRPGFLEARLSLASALAAQGRLKEALAEADKAAELAKDREGLIRTKVAALQSSLREASEKPK